MRKLLIVILALSSSSLLAQDNVVSNRPRLVVGVTVDQMRHEYLYRFFEKFGTGGFKRLMGEGFVLKNAHYNYIPTITGPGHASIYTGSTPSIHGIIANDWYDKSLRKEVNCVGDPSHKTVGSASDAGEVSPWRLLSSTITDELKLNSQRKSKVFGLSIKDRGAALPAGHMADAAFWYDGTNGRVITSTYYMSKLPDWVEKFNQRNLADEYLNKVWNTLLPIEQYTESFKDDSPYEDRLIGMEKRTFPYDLKELRKKNANFNLLPETPFANDYLTELAKTTIDAEKLGADEVTDFLTVSFSSTDILGHAVGPNGVELQDMYLRLDKNIEDLLTTLDQKVGKGNYILFLTADHAVADVAQYLKDMRMPAGYFRSSRIKALVNEYMRTYFPDKDVVEYIDGASVFLDHSLFQQNPKSSGVDFMIATEMVANFLLAQEGVANVYTEAVVRQSNYDEGGIKGMVVRGYHQQRSPDMIVVLQPGWYNSGKVSGTTHGSPYTYDTHVPVLFFGTGIKNGSSVRYHPVTDIAPTLSVMLNIKFPSGATGQPIQELFED
ncbi:MAG TPA: alkaline phosphatase PafA [Chryseosolibacter sp.]|nr:alkaline phosphatase PafA [Chryseosolibacter sp.]